MMSWIAKIGIACILALLVGCKPAVIDPAPSLIRQCEAKCQIQKTHCNKICQDSCRLCEKKAVSIAKQQHQRYLHERCVEGKSFILRLQSYHDPLQCRKMSCDCEADFRVCVTSCRGKIPKQLQVEQSCC